MVDEFLELPKLTKLHNHLKFTVRTCCKLTQFFIIDQIYSVHLVQLQPELARREKKGVHPDAYSDANAKDQGQY